MEPQHYEASKELVRALLAAKRHDEAVAKARELLQQYQQNADVHQVRCCAVWMHAAAGLGVEYRVCAVQLAACTAGTWCRGCGPSSPPQLMAWLGCWDSPDSLDSDTLPVAVTWAFVMCDEVTWHLWPCTAQQW
jgi:hypothetical protein